MEGTAKKRARRGNLISILQTSIPSPSYWLGEDDIEGEGEGSLGTLKKNLGSDTFQ